MLAKKLERLANVLMENETNPNINKDIIIYGLTSAVEQGISMITAIIIGLYFGFIFEVIIFFVSFTLIRRYAGGYHCEKSINCYFISMSIIIGILLIIKYIPNEYMHISSVIILVLSIPMIYKFAPIETNNKPLDDKEQKYYRKKVLFNLVIECFIIILLFASKFSYFGFVMCLGILMSAVAIALQKLFDKINYIKCWLYNYIGCFL